jgi:hypothetical protein
MIVEAALTQAYPRIALVLSTSVDKDKASILAPGPISYEIIYREVERIATSQPYVDDIHRIAGSLTAAYFIRSTPLNSSIQLLPHGDRMEQQAIEDLDRLRGQVLQQINALFVEEKSAKTERKASSPPPTFYFSGLIEGGRSSDQIHIPEGLRGIAVYTLTTNQPVPMEVVVEVPPLIPDLLTTLSEAINNLSIRGDSNVLASPNRGTYAVVVTDCIEGGGALVRLDYITFSPRRTDPIITRELAILSFYLIPEGVPIADWKANVLETSIPSLLYGVVPSYQELHSSGPHSLLVELEKGELVKVDASDSVDTLYIQGDGEGIAKYSITIDGVVHEGVVPLSSNAGTITEQVAQTLREVLGSHALVGELGSYAIQVIPNGTSNILVGLVGLPPGVSTTVGTAKVPLYPYTTGSVALTVNPNSGRSIRRPTMAEEATGVYSATSFRILTSPRMQAVYDKLDRMDRLRGGRCGR